MIATDCPRIAALRTAATAATAAAGTSFVKRTSRRAVGSGPRMHMLTSTAPYP